MSKPEKSCKGGCKSDFCHSAKKDAGHHHHGHKKPAAPANDENQAPKAPKQDGGCGCKSTGCCKP